MAATTEGRYVPPHMRNKAPPVTSPSQQAGPSRIPYTSDSRREQSSAPARSSQSRTPWASSSNTNAESSHDRSSASSSSHQNWELRAGDSSLNTRSAPNPSAHRTAGPSRSNGSTFSPTLYAFGDSFTGPLKLLSDENAKCITFKGSSAKGLNNPNSLKQVSKELVPMLNNLLAPPPYVYTPSTGRWALLIFGNVDLQINYLWQLQNKTISSASFPSDTSTPTPETTQDSAEEGGTESARILATATETTLRGPALGPELFVDQVVHAYTSWLEREIINGPVGSRLKERSEAANDTTTRRKPPPGKLLIAAALPPLVEDKTLSRIPEKYVERLEEDHAKAQKLMEQRGSGVSKTPWSKSDEAEVEEGLSTLNMTDEAPPESPPPTSTGKTSIDELLLHDPPLCTLPIRIAMTNRYNALLGDFCSKHKDVLHFIDISQAILSNKSPLDTDDKEASESQDELDNGTIDGAADRNIWACPVDPTNIHPLWEPTLPLWLEELRKAGVPTQNYNITVDAEETFKNYEIDKRRRFKNRSFEDGEARIKLRDE